MQTSVTFKNIDPSDNLKKYVGDKLTRFDRYLDNPAEANVVLSVEKFRHIAEIHIVGDRLSINGKEETSDMYAAIDMVLDKLEKQIKKNKQKIRSHRGSSKAKAADVMAVAEMSPEQERDQETDQEEDQKKSRGVIQQNIEYKPMDVEEAVMQMDLTPDEFLVFINAKTERVNVLYQRKDGNYGLIQPND